MAKKEKQDGGQLKLDFGIQKKPLKPENNAMLVDVSYPLHAYHPGMKCPNCGRKARPGCPVLCSCK